MKITTFTITAVQRPAAMPPPRAMWLAPVLQGFFFAGTVVGLIAVLTLALSNQL